MAFAAAGRTTTVWRMLEALPHTSESSTLSVPENALVEPFCEAGTKGKQMKATVLVTETLNR